MDTGKGRGLARSGLTVDPDCRHCRKTDGIPTVNRRFTVGDRSLALPEDPSSLGAPRLGLPGRPHKPFARSILVSLPITSPRELPLFSPEHKALVWKLLLHPTQRWDLSVLAPSGA